MRVDGVPNPFTNYLFGSGLHDCILGGWVLVVHLNAIGTQICDVSTLHLPNFAHVGIIGSSPKTKVGMCTTPVCGAVNHREVTHYNFKDGAIVNFGDGNLVAHPACNSHCVFPCQ